MVHPQVKKATQYSIGSAGSMQPQYVKKYTELKRISLMHASKLSLKHILFHAAKLPVLYLVIGIILIAFSFLNHLDIANKIGDIFIALAILTFIYKFLILLLQYQENKSQQITSLILGSIRKSLRIIYILIALHIIISMAGPEQSWSHFASSAIRVIIIAAIGWIAIQVLYTIDAVIYQKTMQLNDPRRANALHTKTRIIRNILSVLIALITFAAILMSFSSVRDIGISLLASAGFLTAIIGLASQKALFSVFSGLQIALAQPIKLGDVVVVDNEPGVVEEITFTYVKVKLADKRRIIVPISYFIEKSFINWSHEPEGMRSSISIYTDYMMPVQPLRDHLDIILRASSLWDGKAAKLLVANFTEHTVELRILISAANEDNLADLRAEVREKMLEFMQKNYAGYFPLFRLKRDAIETP